MSSIVVTGACGFIGSNLVRALNRLAIDNIILVDKKSYLVEGRNLDGCKFDQSMDQDLFLRLIQMNGFDKSVTTIFHQGACSDTTERNVEYIMNSNYVYSREILRWCQRNSINMIFASSASIYGSNKVFSEMTCNESPINLYGFSKLIFDDLARETLNKPTSQIAGLRYFNVYGPGEGFKGKMASLVTKHFTNFTKKGFVELFEGSHGVPPGEQSRDFIHINDVIEVNLHFLRNANISGIFNVGTGISASFNKLTESTINRILTIKGHHELSLSEMIHHGMVRYIPFPDDLSSQYQPFTMADITRLRSCGYSKSFMPIDIGARKCIDELSK